MGRRGVKKKVGSNGFHAGRPEPPGGLTFEQTAAWDQFCNELEAIGRIASTDRGIIESYARNYALLMEVAEKLADQPLTAEGMEGRKYVNPLVATFMALDARIYRILLDCGLSPACRKSDDVGPTDKRAAIFDGSQAI